MKAALLCPGPLGLATSLLLVWVPLALSILLLTKLGSGFGEATPSGPRAAPWTPGGGVIGGVWTVLYTCMACALWILNRDNTSLVAFPRLVVVALICLCLTWPFFAFDTDSRWPGLLGNLGILLLSLLSVAVLRSHSPTAALLILPIAIWISVATASILDGARRFGW